MKVLHIITGLSQGGAERQLANLASVFPGESAVFSLKEPGVMAEEIRKTGVPIYTGGVRRSVSPVWIPKLRKVIRELRPDVVMGWMYHGNLAASLTRRLGHRGPILWNVRHSVHEIRREKASTRWVIRAGAWCAQSPARIVYNSATAAEQHERLGYPAHKRVVLPNGFDLDRFKPDPSARSARRAELGVPSDRFLLGVVARAHPMKNHLGWLKAFRMLVDAGLPVHCVMVGTGVAEPDGPLATTVREAGLESAVTLLPPTDSPETLYPALDLLVMPSLWGEGFPNVVGEAMGCGVPSLVTNVGDSVPLVESTGFVVPEGTPGVLAAAVRKVMGMSAGQLGDLGNRARNRMVQCFALDCVAHEYQDLIRNVLAGTVDRRAL
ncbi:glycosyltransferase [Thioalkalivibrio sp. ALMg13-2]|uniref:glycosyltransferase n=1 Tax=Thioalkalivibrio sp. ALMg13-2 TaxID=1158167 RepID=UPI00037E0464|nr:glycosyltransferase [Thioalkalivibrio sp. ALMg13-2]